MLTEKACGCLENIRSASVIISDLLIYHLNITNFTNMNKNWQGKAISIYCGDSLGIFQGIVKEVNKTKITIVSAFRNGLPLRTLDTEITIM